jgi:hypothetical protein
MPDTDIMPNPNVKPEFTAVSRSPAVAPDSLPSGPMAAEEEPARRYQPTPQEEAAIQSVSARRDARPPAPKLKAEKKDGPVSIAVDHPDPKTGWSAMMNAFGSCDRHFAEGLVMQLANAGTQGKIFDGKGPNFMLAVIQGIGPKDEVEAMLAAQMAAVHMATMTFARKLAHSEDLIQQDSLERAFNKLARTFAVQAEALKRYRTGGEQKVTVQHVTVNEGGQAIVGPVSAASGGAGHARKG